MNKLSCIVAFGIIFFLGFSSVKAQDFAVEGTVYSAEDESTLPGVTVVEEGTQRGTVTDPDGRFTLDVTDPAGFNTNANSEVYIADPDIFLSQTMVDWMQERDDPRVGVYGALIKDDEVITDPAYRIHRPGDSSAMICLFFYTFRQNLNYNEKTDTHGQKHSDHRGEYRHWRRNCTVIGKGEQHYYSLQFV